jgi:eukaryotic-like serine/threonine-protein kinase
MTPERYLQVKAIFLSALDTAPEVRADFLNQQCANDEELFSEVFSLLESHQRSDDFIEIPAIQAISPAEIELHHETLPGQSIGSYQVVKELGHGGMGTVYLAVRSDDQYQKRVAIKLVRSGMDSEFVRKRFRHERQILANLDHPNISRLVDGGTTQNGMPWLAMEYIEGIEITEYCDQKQLSINDRLKIFLQVCSAVQFAHQNLVIHRDIKPGNILITADGTPKLLDFGIAKLVSPQNSQSMDQTVTEMRLMTPGYASPEQARGESITTASDVYSLGVVLYELLTGHRPYHVSAQPANEVLRIICEEQPSKPSTSVSKTEALTNVDGSQSTITPEMVSRAREGQPGKLRKRLSGDLDNIVLMAMRKEPQRRYASISQLSEDLRRHLEGLPVFAREDNFKYRAGKFIARHKVGVAATILITLSLLGGMMTTLWQARKAERRFNDVRRLANSFMFEVNDAIEKLPGSTPARALLVKRALEYLDSLAQESSNDVTLQRELATAYQKVGKIQGDPYYANLGDIDGASQSYRKALTIYQLLVQNNPHDETARAELATCYIHLGDVQGFMHNSNEAMKNYRLALNLREQLIAEHSTRPTLQQELASCYEGMGDVLRKNGDSPGALEQFRKTLSINEKLVSQEPGNQQLRRALAVMYRKVANGLDETDDKAGGLEAAHKALAIFEALASSDASPQNQSEVATTYNQIGDLSWGANKFKDALENYRRSLILLEGLSAADLSDAKLRRSYGLSLANVGDVLAQNGEAQGAITYNEKAMAILESLVANNPNNTDLRSDLAAYRVYFGDACKILATRKNISRTRQINYWQAAITQYRLGQKIFLSLLEQGALRGKDEQEPNKLYGEIAQCETALAKLQGKR